MKLFVTVGSTEFPELIAKVLSNQFIDLLRDLKFTDLTIQAGSTREIPSHVGDKSLKVEIYSYKPSIQHDMEDSLMIISHAGTGSILEALSFGKKLLVVVNDSLMDNHQAELSDELSPEYLESCNISNLINAFISCYHADKKKPWTDDHFTIESIVRDELNML